MKKYLICNLSNLLIAFELDSIETVMEKYEIIPAEFYLSFFPGYYLNPIDNRLLPVIDFNNLYNILPKEKNRKMLLIKEGYGIIVDNADRVVESKVVSLKRSKKIEGVSYKSYIKYDNKVVPVIALSEIESRIAKEKKIEDTLKKKSKILKIKRGYYSNEKVIEENIEGEEKSILVFKYNERLYGVDTEFGYYIADNVLMTRYPYSDRLAGIINLRGEMINILSSNYVYNDKEIETKTFVIVEEENVKIGLKAQSVLSMYKINQSKLMKKKDSEKFIDEVYKNEIEVFIINVPKLMNDLKGEH